MYQSDIDKWQKTPCGGSYLFSILKQSDERKMRFLAVFLMFLPVTAMAEVLSLYDALRATYTACVGIDEELSGLKTMAGINTAVTGVGTAAGIGATVTGLVKASKDEQIEKLEMERLRKIVNSGINDNVSNGNLEDNLLAIQSYYDNHKDDAQVLDIDSQIDKLTQQSKNLGNWRTGLLAGSTATNVAGAVIAGTNKVSVGLREQINSCISAVDDLQQSMMQARLNGEDISEAQSIVDVCSEYKYVDISKIDDTEAGKQKEKNLNTASNVLAGFTTAASATATVFNATQISAIKKVAEVAEKCTGVLK